MCPPRFLKRLKKGIRSFSCKNIELIIADVRKLPLKSRSTDAIVSLGVLKHIPNQPSSTISALKEMARVGKAGCVVYCNDLPNLLHPEAWIYKIAIKIWTKVLKRFTTGTYFYIPSHLTFMLKRINAKNVIFYGVGWRFSLTSIFVSLPLLSRLFKKSYVNPVFTKESSGKPSILFSSYEITFAL